jgi:acetyl-CoA acetyltransferase
VTRAAIAGIGQTAFTDGSDTRSGLELAAEAIMAAAADAGIPVSDVDGVVKYTLDPSASLEMLSANLGLKEMNFFTETPIGGGANCAGIQLAAMAVEAGYANAVVCFRAFTSVDYGEGLRRNPAWLWASEVGMKELARVHGFGAISQSFALQAQRHMYEFGTTEAQLGAVVESATTYASRNPNALKTKPIPVEEYLATPYVTSPLRDLDCFQPSAGACAVIVTTAQRARDLRQPPAHILAAISGSANRFPPYWELWPLRRGEITNGAPMQIAPRLYGRAGITPNDVDVAELYDCFSFTVLMALEAYGFCEYGGSGPFVEEGNIRPGGSIPVNTHGGHLGEAYIHGYNHIVEAVRQIRGTSSNQVQDAEIALVTGGPGFASSAMLLAKDA